MILARSHLDQMVRHALEVFPIEACGLLGMDGNRVVRVYPLPNAAQSRVRYEIAPRDQVRALMEIWDARLEVGGIYHSHPSSAACPSQTDIREAHSPDAVYVIISLAGTRPELKAYRIIDGMVTEEPLQVDDQPDTTV